MPQYEHLGWKISVEPSADGLTTKEIRAKFIADDEQTPNSNFLVWRIPPDNGDNIEPYVSQIVALAQMVTCMLNTEIPTTTLRTVLNRFADGFVGCSVSMADMKLFEFVSPGPPEIIWKTKDDRYLRVVPGQYHEFLTFEEYTALFEETQVPGEPYSHGQISE